MGMRVSVPPPRLPWTAREIMRRPLPALSGEPLARLLTRAMLLVLRRRILDIEGADFIRGCRGPLIVAANHSQYTEALLFPAALAFLRDGRRVRFIADWNFCLIPPLALMYWAAQAILVTRKPARVRCLDVVRPLFASEEGGFRRARMALAAGESIGIFPEGVANRDAGRMLRGFSGAAWLSLTTGVPLLPVGLAYPGVPREGRVSDSAPMAIRFGDPLPAEPALARPPLSRVRECHHRLMGEIARLCGKTWTPDAPRELGATAPPSRRGPLRQQAPRALP